MAKKYYAVKKGRKTGIFETWDECKGAVTGFSGAVYKSFISKEEALKYMEGSGDSNKESNARETEAVAYVDGSYDNLTKSYSYGMVMIYRDKELYFSKGYKKDGFSDMRNVAGEIHGAMAAMTYCMDNNIRSISIFYDYEGIEKWCTGDWQAKKEGTMEYVKFYKNASKYIDIVFVKVKGHSGDKYNDMADKLAKEALGL